MNRVKITLILLFTVAALTSCDGQSNQNTHNLDSLSQLIKVPVSVGLGTLDISFDLPVPLYRTKNDTLPIDTLTFERDISGEWLYKTNRVPLNPYQMSGGDSDAMAKSNIGAGLGRFPPLLSFRVVEADDRYWRVVVDESTFETVVIRKNPDYESLPHHLKILFGNMKNPCYAYETWEHLLMRVAFVYFEEYYAVYDAPEGEKIFENTNDNFLPYSVTQVSGDWMKVKKGSGRESRFYGMKNAEGWVKWKNDTEILVKIIEYLMD